MTALTSSTLGVFFWFLVSVLVLAALFASSLGYSFPLWRNALQYWPWLLVAWGLLKLIDLYRSRNDSVLPFANGEVGVLIGVLVMGSMLTAGMNLGFRTFGMISEEIDLFDVLDENYRFVSTIEREVQSSPQVEIYHPNGSVEVAPTGDPRIRVNVTTRIHAANQDEARQLAAKMAFSLRELGNVYVVESNRNELETSLRRRFSSSLRIQLPTNSAVSVHGRNGTVRISGLTGSQEVENRYGDVYLTFAEPLQSSVRVSGVYTDVHLRLPATSAFSMNARTDMGSISNDFEALQTLELDGRSQVTGYTAAGGPNIDVETRLGNILIQRR